MRNYFLNYVDARRALPVAGICLVHQRISLREGIGLYRENAGLYQRSVGLCRQSTEVRLENSGLCPERGR